MIVRRPLLTAAVTGLVAAAVAVGCVPPDQGEPPTADPLPEAPRLRFSSALPDDAIAIVSHTNASGHGADYVVDADGARPWDPTELDDRRLMAQAFGSLSNDGVELRDSDDGGLERCTEFEGGECDDVPHLGFAGTRGFSPDGSRFAVVDDPVGTPVLRVYDTTTLDVVVEVPVTSRPGHQPPVWSPDSTSLLVLVPVDSADGPSVGSLATLQVAPAAEPVILETGHDDSFAGAPIGWSDDGTLSYFWVQRLGLDVTEITIRTRSADGEGDERILGETGFLSFFDALRDGSVIAAPPIDENGGGEVPHLFGPAAGTVTPLARPQLATIGGGQTGSTTRIIGIVEPR